MNHLNIATIDHYHRMIRPILLVVYVSYLIQERSSTMTQSKEYLALKNIYKIFLHHHPSPKLKDNYKKCKICVEDVTEWIESNKNA